MKKFTLAGVASLFLLVAAPVAADGLACTAQLCLYGGASCGNSMYPGCGAAVNTYCDFDKFSKRDKWLNSCQYEGSAEVIQYITQCSRDNIFQYLYVRTGFGLDVRTETRLDVPPACKRFAQKQRAEYLKIPAEYRVQLTELNLLPVLSMRWHTVYDYRGEVIAYEPKYSWTYNHQAASKRYLVNNPNTGQLYQCPLRYAGDRQTIFSTKTGCNNPAPRQRYSLYE